jgi:hypothetical protein
MSLVDLLKTSPDELFSKHVWQIIAFAGTGKLLDGGDTSAEFREVLSNIPLEALSQWGQEAARGKFDGSGFALQDIVNEIGRRLGFTVRPGTYRGGGGEPYDGLWQATAGHCVVVETKTSDNFTIDLNKLAEYRRQVLTSKRLREQDSSILLVLGRQDTGDYEDRIKGSRYAFIMRFITVDGLLRLLALKQAATSEYASANLSVKIFELFTSPKFIGLDTVVDLVAAAPVLPIPTERHGGRPGGGDDQKNAADRRAAEALFDKVRTAGASGVTRRNLQRRFPQMRGKRFGELLDLLINSHLLQTKKTGRKTLVTLGEGAFKDQLLLALAKRYEEADPRGEPPSAVAAARGFPADLAARVTAELRAEGSVEPKGVFADIVRFTDFGYQKYLPRIRALREMAKDAQQE